MQSLLNSQRELLLIALHQPAGQLWSVIEHIDAPGKSIDLSRFPIPVPSAA
jgi:hypothetical protein